MRRIRPWVVLAGCVLAVVVAAGVVAWRQGDFWRASAAHYLRERLAAELGAEFQAPDLRGRWLPPGLSLGRVTLHRPGEPWVLTAEDVRISFNLYAVLFGRERLGRVVVDRPRLFVRQRAAPAGEAGAAAGPTAAAPPLAERVRRLLRPPYLLRVLEITDGRVEVLGRDGDLLRAEGIDLALLLSGGSARAALEVASLSGGSAGRRVAWGRVDADFVLGDGGVRVSRVIAAGGPLAGTLRGEVDYAGGLSLTGECTASIERLASLAGRAGLAGGRARFEGKLTGKLREPEAEGSLSLAALALRGRRWPDARGRVAWSKGRLAVSDLLLKFGDGSLGLAGSAEIAAGAVSRYALEAQARALDPALLPGVPAEGAARVRTVDGTLRWDGAGFGSAAAGSGSLQALVTLALLPQERFALETRAVLAGGALALDPVRLSGASLEAAGSGAWRPGEGFSCRLSGAVADLGRLAPGAGVALGGGGSFEGEAAFAAAGWRSTGTVRLAKASVGKVRGIDAAGRLEAAAGAVRLLDVSVAWPGVRGVVAGSIALPGGALAATARVEELSAAAAARLLGADPAPATGTLDAQLRLQGTLRDPTVAGEVSGGALRYRAAAVDSAELAFSYAAGRFDIERLRLRRGASELSLEGELSEESLLSADFESRVFDLRDFASLPGLELAGTLRGRAHGPLDALVVDGALQATRLRYGGFDLRGGELAVKYRGGTIGVTGWLAAPENRLRAVLEPAAGWRFESELDLQRFAPEIVRSGAGGFPPALARIVGQASFLAAGTLRAEGRLLEPSGLRAALRLETLWLQAAGGTLQNRAPVQVSWRGGVLAVEDFRLLGDQYHLALRGTGSPAAGWDLQAEGAVNLALLRGYSKEIEEIDGSGDLRLSIGGPWTSPQPEGDLTVRDAFLKLRPLPEPLSHLEGRLELRAGTLTAASLSGSMGDGSFRGGGSYRIAEDLLDAEVEGGLDLSLFRSRLPGARELRGPLRVRLRMAGPLAGPAFTGDVEIVDAELFARPFPAKITRLHGRLRLGADRLEILELSGQTGGGKIGLSGSLALSPAPGTVDLDLRGDGILVSLAEGLKAQADLRLGLRGALSAPHLAGEVRVLKARYLREFDEKPPRFGAAAAGDAAAPARPEVGRTTLDVKVRATDNVWIANRMAKIEAAVALDLSGTLGAPVLRGEISAIHGEAYYLSRKFRLESGSLRFVPPATVPVLDLQASTSVGETQILFLMAGPLNGLSYHLVSLPAMSQEDLVALLTIGETRSALAQRGEKASAAGAAVFTTEPLVNALGDEARTAMGLDVLQLEPVVGDDNQVSARVTLGTHLSDRLYVSYSRSLGATEDQQVAVQYFLLDYLSLWGQELRQGVYSVDAVFRYTFR